MQGMIDRLDVIQNMALRDQQVLPAIVVEILEANSPATARGEAGTCPMLFLDGDDGAIRCLPTGPPRYSRSTS